MGLRIPIPVAAAIVVIVGCVTTGPRGAKPKEPTLTETVDAQIAREDGIAWTLRRRLAWADFKGTAPENSGVLGAQTAYRIIDGVRCVGPTTTPLLRRSTGTSLTSVSAGKPSSAGRPTRSAGANHALQAANARLTSTSARKRLRISFVPRERRRTT